MGSLITIDDGNYLQHTAYGAGLVPRDFNTRPVGYYAYAAPLPDDVLIPESQWDDLIKQQEDTQSSLEHLMRLHKVDALDQNGQGYCVIPGTMIQMANTLPAKKPIETIKVGEQVVTAEGRRGTVVKTMSRLIAEPIVMVNTDTSQLLLTGEHPVLTQKGYVPTWSLKPGTSVAHYDGMLEWTTIKSVETRPYQGAVFNLAVEGDNSYVAEGIGVHNCWSYSTTGAVMGIRIKEGQPHVPLSGHMIGCLVKNYRDQGGWNAQSLEFVCNNGVASQVLWPQGSMSKSNDTPTMRADAAGRKVTEFYDLAESGDKVQRQLGSLLLQNIPVMVDFNWWGHSVVAIRLVKRDPFTIRIRNSWGNSWSDNGYGDLVGSKAIPNGAAAPRVSTPSPLVGSFVGG